MKNKENKNPCLGRCPPVSELIHKEKFIMKFYCEVCEEYQSVVPLVLKKDKDGLISADIVCAECRLFISTIVSESEGVVKLVSKEEAERIDNDRKASFKKKN